MLTWVGHGESLTPYRNVLPAVSKVRTAMGQLERATELPVLAESVEWSVRSGTSENFSLGSIEKTRVKLSVLLLGPIDNELLASISNELSSRCRARAIG